jgi:microcystin degradation protein MlrC
MSLRVAIGGFQHESHSFAPLPTQFADFVQPGGFPGLQTGAGLIPAVRTTSVPIAGAIEAGEKAGLVLLPTAWCIANPAGPVQDSAFERIAALICAALSGHLQDGPLDGVYLDLHGAALAVSFPDAEGELLRRVRRIVGPDTKVTASLDPHCNLTAQMVAEVDVVVPYRTYPHVDMKQAGAQAMRLLLALIARGKPYAKAFRQVDFWPPLGSQCTLMEPMAGVLAKRAELSQGLAELAFCFGFPYADFADCGAAVAGFGDTAAEAERAAEALVDYITAREAEFGLDVISAAEAVALAKSAPESNGGGPIILADTQDNPGGGGHGDTTGLLAEMIRQAVPGAVFCLINDAESAAACHEAGAGAVLALSLGGKSDGAPLAVQAKVLLLSDGRFTLSGPMGAGNPADLGPSALIEAGGVQVIVVSRKMQALDQAILRHFGIEPAACGVIALKSSVHFRADFAPLAKQIIVALAPGPVIADPATLNFAHVRPSVRRRPRA